MKITMLGTRGSTSGQPRGSHKFGGNTTCLRIHSDCIPEDVALAVDAGSGFTQFSRDALCDKKMRLAVLFTHYHHDHTQGLLLAPHTYIEHAELEIWGPKEHRVGPNEVFTQLMTSPYFPVEFVQVKDRFTFHPLENIGTQVLVIHPRGGFNLLPLDVYRKCVRNGKQVAFRSGRYDIDECLVVHMYKTVHPEYTVSYRFEERPTRRVFVFLTDHEKTAALPRTLQAHLQGANLLIQDSQYSEVTYTNQTAGYGHGTPVYCVECAYAAEAQCLGLTHHDPGASDADIEKRLAEANAHVERLMREKNRPSLQVFACADDQVYEV